MGYKRKPNYHFATKTETGLDGVPLGRMIVCENYDGEVKVFVYADDTSVTGATTIEQAVGASNLVLDKVTIDATPTDASDNAVSSNGTFDALADKHPLTSVDSTPTNGSSNLVSSDGVYDAINSGIGGGAVKAWINFNGTTATATADLTGVRGSANVTSLVDNGVGKYTVNLTTAIVDANYAITTSHNKADASTATSNDGATCPHTFTTTSFQLICVDSDTIFTDQVIVCAVLTR